MWILVLLSVAHYGQNTAAIPISYDSEMSCIRAGDEWRKRARMVSGTFNYVCIPGPDNESMVGK